MVTDESRGQEQVFELSLAPQTSRYDPEDDRWRMQVTELLVGLQQEVGGVRRDSTASEGTKGGAEQLIVALGSAGAFTAAVEFVKAWLARDRTRSLQISWSGEGGVNQSVSVSGEGVDLDAMQQLAQAVAARISGAA